MDSRTRVRTAMRHHEPDTIPVFELMINDSKIAEVLHKEVTPANAADLYFEAHRELGLDMISVWLDGMVNPTSGAATFADPVGRQYVVNAGTGIIWYCGGLVATETDLLAYSPDPTDGTYYARAGSILKAAKDRLAVMGMLDGIVELVSQSMGIEAFCSAVYDQPEFLRKNLAVRGEFVLESAKRLVGMGVDALVFCDDCADKKGPLISPNHYRELVAPIESAILSALHKEWAELPVIAHCDGNIWPLIDSYAEIGFNGIHAIEPVAGMDLGEVKKRYGERMILIGNVDCGHTLCEADLESVRREVRSCIDKAAPGGGFILSSSNTIHDGVNIENYRAMIHEARQYGRRSRRAT